MNKVDELLLEHFDDVKHSGVPGMKWGVRRQRRQQALERAGTKGGFASSRVRGTFGRLGPVDLIRGRGIQKGLARKAVRVRGQLDRKAAGKATTMDLVKRYGSTRVTDLVPVRASQTSKKTSHKSDIAMVTAAGALVALQVLGRVAAKRASRG